LTRENEVVAVTGGGSGIGAGVCRRLAGDGASVLVLDRNGADAAKVADEIGGIAHEVDVTDEKQVDALYASFGRLTGMVNCAGFNLLKPVVSMSLAEWRTMTAVHLDGAFLNLKAAASSMLRHEVAGSIVSIASVNGKFAHRGMSGYAASKAGVSMLTRVAALELASAGIRVNAVAPGVVLTGMTAQSMSDPAVIEEWVHGIPMGRLGEPSDIAAIVAFLLGPDSGWLTGQTILADGGAALRVEPTVTDDADWTPEALRRALEA
jgi:3-oxoacyl-[acyl-carrier protein] reductase